MVLHYTQVGTCAMEGPQLVCTDPNGPILELSPTGTGACSVDDAQQTALCNGALTIKDRWATDPNTGEPTLLYTMYDEAGECTVQNQDLICTVPS